MILSERNVYFAWFGNIIFEFLVRKYQSKKLEFIAMSRLRILIAEDNSLVAEDIAGSLEDIGYLVVDKVKSGEEAVKSVKANTPDLVLMDINLKGEMDGIEAVKEIQAFITVPVIYLTAYSDERTFKRAKSTNPDAFITKPFDEKDLCRAIDLAIHNFASKNQDITAEAMENESHHVFNDAIFIKIDRQYIKIPVDSIMYIEAHGSYLKIFTGDAGHMLTMNLHSFELKIRHQHLMRINRSYIVNLKKVASFEKDHLVIGKKSITISKKIQEDFRKRFLMT